MRDLHGDERGEVYRYQTYDLIRKEAKLKYQTYGLGSFVQGLDKEDLERLLRLHLRFVSISFEFLLIYMCLACFIKFCVHLHVLRFSLLMNLVLN
jgi:hypothetical protein